VIRVVIADDEEATALLIQEALQMIGDVEVLGIASNGLECLQLFEELHPDALFLDINMSQLSGIEVAESVMQTENPPLIAFITNFDEFAVRAFELNAVDYIVKIGNLSTMMERISRTIERMHTALEQKSSALAEIRKVIAHLSQQQLHPLQRKLPIRDAEEGTIRLLDPIDVICIIRQQRRTMLVTRKNAYPTYFTIDSLDVRLADEGFIRANPGTLINSRYIDQLLPNGDGSYDVFLKTDLSGDVKTLQVPITVSRARARQLVQILNL